MYNPPSLTEGSISLKEGEGTIITHDLTAEAALAVRAAYAAGRPLLVRGEPGVGKSQLAQAVAEAWSWKLISKTVDASSESRDLHYHFDDLARLGEAQLLAAKPTRTAAEALKPARFLSPGPLWWAFDWQSASRCYQASDYAYDTQIANPQTATESAKPSGVVVLIDEIDKAEPELPNGLLETLGQRSIAVPHHPERITQNPDLPAPLVIITTNEERELPPAFMRRCWVLKLALPTEKQAFLAQLSARGEAHFAKKILDPALYTQAAEQLWESRKTARTQGQPLPGQAEYLDLLRAISTLANTAEAQHSLYTQAAHYVMDKAGYDEQR